MPPDITTSVTTALLTQGVLGVCCIVLGFVVLKLWAAREGDRVVHKAEVAAERALNAELQDQRLSEALAAREAIKSMQTTLDAFLQALHAGKGQL